MPTGALTAIDKRSFDYWAAHHLLNRAGFGGTPEEVRALANLGRDDAVDSLLDYHDIADEQPVEPDTFDANIMTPPTQDERQRLRRAREAGNEEVVETYRTERQRRQRADRQQMAAMQQWWLSRILTTPRPLQEKMTLFLHGHFATSYRGTEDSYHLFLQNQTFRAHATGNFKALTHAMIRDPAMLRYLNNNQNRKQKPNENLARELMELFTLGEGNAYTEQDIKEGARALTGYTYVDDQFVGPGSRQYRNLHDDTKKRILGQTGNFDGDDLINIIFQQRYVSEFVCLKLYRFFVNDLPNGVDEKTRAFIMRLARKFRTGGYELKTVLRTLFRSEHFYDETNRAAVIKSPVQLLVQARRSLRSPKRDPRTMLGAMDMMGQNIFFPPSVKGWDGGRAWINTSTLFIRQNVLIYLLTGRNPDARRGRRHGETYHPLHLVEHLAGEDGRIDPNSAVRYVLHFALGTKPHEERVAELLAFLESVGGRITDDSLLGILCLIAAMPEYQLC